MAQRPLPADLAHNLLGDLGAAACICALVSLAACAPGNNHPNVVLITLDTTRADHLSLYGYGRGTDPNLSLLAANARVFDAAISPATWTLPAHASLFTGLHPAEHGSYLHTGELELKGRDYAGLASSLPLLTTRLSGADFHCIGAVGGPFLSERYGFRRSFDAWLDPGERWQLPGTELARWADEQLAAAPQNRPVFLFVNFFDAHAPHAPPPRGHWPFPPEVGDLEAIDLKGDGWNASSPPTAALLEQALIQYDRELLVQDEALGDLLQSLSDHGRDSELLLIVTGDHGESFGENDQFGHGNLPFEPVARVPLVVKRAPEPIGGRVIVPVSTVGVAASILGALDLASLPGARGVDLLDDEVLSEVVYSEHRAPGDWIGVLRSDRLAYGRPVEEPGSVTNELLARHAPRAPELVLAPEDLSEAEVSEALLLRDALDRLRAGWRASPTDLETVELTEEERAELDALGYGGR